MIGRRTNRWWRRRRRRAAGKQQEPYAIVLNHKTPPALINFIATPSLEFAQLSSHTVLWSGHNAKQPTNEEDIEPDDHSDQSGRELARCLAEDGDVGVGVGLRSPTQQRNTLVIRPPVLRYLFRAGLYRSKHYVEEFTLATRASSHSAHLWRNGMQCMTKLFPSKGTSD